MIVIANSTPLITLSKVGKLNLLKDIFGEIIIPQGVYDEVCSSGSGKAWCGEGAEGCLDTRRAGV